MFKYIKAAQKCCVDLRTTYILTFSQKYDSGFWRSRPCHLSILKPLPKLGRAADQFRFMGAHSWDFTNQSYFFQ